MAIRVDSYGMFLADRQLPVYSGSVHYWRHPPEAWRTILERVKELGFEIIQTPIPWGLHESGPGIFDFGQKNPQKNLTQFIDLCAEIGLLMILCPGPFVDEEMPLSGFPMRLVRNSAVWALTSTGAPAVSNRTLPPFPLPSYASERLYQEVGKFYDALAPVIVPKQYPDGPIILCQINRETAFHGRMESYDLDYSPESINLYHRFLTEKYASVDRINEVYGTKYDSIDAIPAPMSFDAVVQRDLPWYMDWVEYKEYLILRASQRLGQMLIDRRIVVPLSIDGPQVVSTPVNILDWQRAADISLVGLEVESNPGDYADLAMKVRYLRGSCKLPFASRFGSGNSWLSPRVRSPADEEFAVLCGIMHGLNAINFHMLAEGDRWVGAPITRTGAVREEYADLFRRWSAFFTKYDIWNTKKHCRTLVLLSHELERYHRTFSTMNYGYLGLLRIPALFSEVQSSLGFQVDPAKQSFRVEGSWIREACRYLDGFQVEYNIADTHLPLDELTKYDIVFLPTADFMEPQDQQKLIEFADRGGNLVFGPGIPTLDVAMNPMPVLSNLIQEPGSKTQGSGKITFLPSFDLASDLITSDMPNIVLLDNPNLRSTIREGNSLLFFIANPTGSIQRSMIISSWPLRGVWNAPEDTQTGSVTAELNPYSVQVWEVLK
jgi:beta-galactosidase